MEEDETESLKEVVSAAIDEYEPYFIFIFDAEQEKFYIADNISEATQQFDVHIYTELASVVRSKIDARILQEKMKFSESTKEAIRKLEALIAINPDLKDDFHDILESFNSNSFSTGDDFS